jgi:hypothetical protein
MCHDLFPDDRRKPTRSVELRIRCASLDRRPRFSPRILAVLVLWPPKSMISFLSSHSRTSHFHYQIPHRCSPWRRYRYVITLALLRSILNQSRKGPEVIAQATRILVVVDAATPDISLKLESHQFGGCAIDATGEPLPAATLKACQEADAILMGNVGL